MKKQNENKRYQRIPGQSGIRKDLKTGKYLANKRINGKQYSKQFRNILDAKRWRLSYMPDEDKAVENLLTLGELITFIVTIILHC